jgi:hypothetical protein
MKAEKALKIYATEKFYVEVYKYDKNDGEILIDNGNAARNYFLYKKIRGKK